MIKCLVEGKDEYLGSVGRLSAFDVVTGCWMLEDGRWKVKCGS